MLFNWRRNCTLEGIKDRGPNTDLIETVRYYTCIGFCHSDKLLYSTVQQRHWPADYLTAVLKCGKTAEQVHVKQVSAST